MDCDEMSANNYHSTLCNVQEERRYHFNCGGRFGSQLHLTKENTDTACLRATLCVRVFVRMCLCLFPKNLGQLTGFHENSYECHGSNLSLFHVLLLPVINPKWGQFDVQKWKHRVQFLIYGLAVSCARRQCKGTHVTFNIHTLLGSS